VEQRKIAENLKYPASGTKSEYSKKSEFCQQMWQKYAFFSKFAEKSQEMRFILVIL